MKIFSPQSAGATPPEVLEPVGFDARSLLLCALVSLVVVALQIVVQEPEPRQPDEQFYLTIANDIHQHGVFSTARARGVLAPDSQPPPSDNYSGPLYPAMLALLAQGAPGIERALDCAASAAVTKWSECEGVDLTSLFRLQATLGALSLLGALIAFRSVEARPAFAWVALVVLLGFGLQARLATSVLPDGVSLAALLLFAGAFCAALVREHVSNWIACGVCLGLAALARPSALYLLPLLIPFLIVRRGGLRAILLMGTGLALVVGPWVARNAIMLDQVAFTGGSYGGITLAQRVAYNMMTLQEWLAAFVYWLPDFGDKLAATLFEPATYERLRFDAPSGFYALGNSEVLAEARARANRDDGVLDVLVRYWILEAPLTHIVTTAPLFLRGLWIVGYAGLFAVLFAWVPFVAAPDASTRRRFFHLALPFVLLAGLHAAATINIPRYNFGLSIVYAAILAYLIMWAGDRLREWWCRPSTSP